MCCDSSPGDVTASEAGTYAFCAKAWHLEQVLGSHPSDAARKLRWLLGFNLPRICNLLLSSGAGEFDFSDTPRAVDGEVRGGISLNADVTDQVAGEWCVLSASFSHLQYNAKATSFKSKSRDKSRDMPLAPVAQSPLSCCATQWPGRELNPRHADFQSAALPTELPGRRVGKLVSRLALLKP
jgi:hypothetical protein